MKTLITLIATAVFTFVSSFVFADTKPEPVRFFKVESIIDHYIDAANNGKTEFLNDLFTQNFKYSTPNNGKNELIGRKDLINYWKSTKGIKLDAKTDYAFVEKNDDCSIVRIRTSFENFTRFDYITLCNSKDGWKISNVTVTYPEKK